MPETLETEKPLEVIPVQPLSAEQIHSEEARLMGENPFNLVRYGFLTIKTKSKGMQKLYPNTVQAKFIDTIEKLFFSGKPVRILVLKARQMGISTIIEAMIYAFTSRMKGINSFVIADDLEGANYIFEMQKMYQEYLDKHLKPRIKHSNEKKLAFSGLQSQILIDTADNKNIGRKFTIQFSHLSECSRYTRPLPEILSGLGHAVPNSAGTMVFLETTANGYEEFYDLWISALNGKSDWIPLFYAWHEFPEYQLPLEGGKLYPIDNVRFATPLEKENFLMDEQVITKRYGLTQEQLNWRRWDLVNNCSGDINKFNEDNPSCVSGDTMVSTNPTGIFEIQDTKINDKITHLHKNGIRNTVILRTKSGRILTVTNEHHIHLPIGEFKKVGELNVGEKISLSAPYFAKKEYTFIWQDTPIMTSCLKIDRDVGRFLGYFMGDGCFSCLALSLHCYKDFDVINDIKELMYKITGEYPHIRETGKKNGNSWELRLQSKKAQNFLDRVGALKLRPSDQHKKIRKVCVPKCIFQSTKEVVKEFLRGIFETDGYAGYKNLQVSLFSEHEDFLRQVQLLLLGFSITSTIHIRNKTAGDGHLYIGRELRLKAHEARIFVKEIGFVSKRKNERINSFTKKSFKTRFIEMVDEVESITPNEKIEVFDLTVEPEHTYSANGILVHNCWQDAFVATGNLYFNREALKKQEIQKPVAIGNIVKEDGKYIFREDGVGLFKIYEFPKKGEQYVVAGDPAEGLEHGDKSAGIVLNKRSNKTACTYNHNIAPDRFEEDLIKMGSFYNEAIVACENKGYGYSVNQGLYKHYGKVYRRVKTKTGIKEPTLDLGFNTNSVSRPQMLSQLSEEITEGSTDLLDQDLIQQAWTFINNLKRGQPEADRGKCDDMVMCRAIAGQIRLENPYKERILIKIKRKHFRGLSGY